MPAYCIAMLHTTFISVVTPYSPYAMVCYAMACHVMVCHVMVCNAMVCYAMVCDRRGLILKALIQILKERNSLKVFIINSKFNFQKL